MNERIDAVTLQVLVGSLRAICDEMGAVLIRASHSPNIKERRDCSTAIFSAEGELVMQAEHIPVHLGSMPEAVAAVVGEDHSSGRSWILNDPFAGGTHLPDITVITPVLVPGGPGPIAFTASRAHHADVGGPTPAGMPADSRSLAEEGVVIPPAPIGEDTLGGLAEQMRNPSERLADLRAQLAANRIGNRRLTELIESGTPAAVSAGMSAILDYSERRARAAISELADGSWTASDVLEAADGAEIPLEVAVTVRGETVEIDFTGSADQVDGNLNCPLAVTRSASLFAVRALTDPDAPASAGAHRAVSIRAPRGTVLNAEPGAAVAAGNVETSSRVADLVIEALGEACEGPAQGQGTMNNLTLAGGGFTYYETIAGGQGACNGANGPSAVHVTMSNTLNTPIEALESALPIRVRRVAIRRGSGGKGRWRGGDGVIREIEALEPMDFTLITERRLRPPKARAGGKPGAPGKNSVNGDEIPAKTAGNLAPGDVLRVETPGGGGYGAV
jgi:N-methylhydantoinase B